MLSQPAYLVLYHDDDCIPYLNVLNAAYTPAAVTSMLHECALGYRDTARCGAQACSPAVHSWTYQGHCITSAGASIHLKHELLSACVRASLHLTVRSGDRHIATPFATGEHTGIPLEGLKR